MRALRSWAQAKVKDREAVVAAAARALAAAGILGEEQATKLLTEIVPTKPMNGRPAADINAAEGERTGLPVPLGNGYY